MTSPEPEADIYPVGLLKDIQAFIHSPNRAFARSELRGTFRYAYERARAGEWRAVKSWMNGYLAEPTPFPEGLKRCGSGWTRGRAYRDLNRRLAALDDTEASR